MPGAIVRAEDQAVAITDFAYAPNPLTIDAGSVVTWSNTSGQDHTVTSDSGTALASGTLGPGDSYGNLFDTPGTYSYHCEIHPTLMKGTIIVTAAATQTPSGSPAPTPPPGTLPPDFKTPIATVEASPSETPGPRPSDARGTGASSSGTLLVVGLLLALLIAVILLYATLRRRGEG